MIIRKISYLLLTIVLLLSCRRESPVLPGSFVDICIVSDDSPDTKTSVDGVDLLLHENKISHVDFFFYPGDALDQDATYHVRRTSGKNRSDVFRLDVGSNIVNTLIFPKDAQRNVQTCKVFAVVNYPEIMIEGEGEGGTSWPSEKLVGTSISQLKGKIVQTDFLTPGCRNDDDDPEFVPDYNTHYHKDFLMSGEETLQLNGRSVAIAASGRVNVDRYACKLTVGVNVADVVSEGTDIWMPMLEGMEVYLVNAVDKVTLGGRLPSPKDTDDDYDGDYFSFKDHPMPFAKRDQATDELIFYYDKTGDYYNTYPFYMYPQKWEHSSVTAPDKEPYLKLVIPWIRVIYDEDGKPVPQNQKQFYYKVVIPDDKRTPSSDYLCQFVRNNWYHINVDVSILGSEVDEAEVTANGSVFVVYWQDKNVVVKNAEIGMARYLSVDKESYEIHNLPMLDISYASSHPVALVNLRATRPYYGEEGPGNPGPGDPGPGGKGIIQRAGDNDPHGYEKGNLYLDFSEEAKAEATSWFKLDEANSYVRFEHPVNNYYREVTFDYAPYTVSFSLVHDDQKEMPTPEYIRNVCIVQKPGIFIEKWENSDANNKYNGYVYIDGAQYKRTTSYDVVANWYKDNKSYTFTTDKDPAKSTSRLIPELQDLQWRVINYTGGSKPLYRIDVTVIPEDSDFVIGDARMTSVDNLDDDNCFLRQAPFNARPRFKGTPASDTDVPAYTANPPEDSNYWKTWSESAWSTVYNKFSSNPKPVEASVPYSWRLESAAWSYARAIVGTEKDGEGKVSIIFSEEPRTLEHYYPADPSDRTSNLMAPSYLIASKYGGTEYYDGTPYAEAVYKCASYQEDGYPAGRWRLPTRAEIRFIAMLSANKAFTFLFGVNGKYWSANGAVLVQEDDIKDADDATFAMTRCVYDIWYWGDEDRLPKGDERKIFTWGDRER